ncbi:uncharacterized protein V1518DRAFT_227343 [Limtongia smithiae]|uniref:uncharacterized protein n=1 Tax=Limtongia smithiae TaxID=1125753 RepID=UPI0034CF1502
MWVQHASPPPLHKHRHSSMRPVDTRADDRDRALDRCILPPDFSARRSLDLSGAVFHFLSGSTNELLLGKDKPPHELTYAEVLREFNLEVELAQACFSYPAVALSARPSVSEYDDPTPVLSYTSPADGEYDAEDIDYSGLRLALDRDAVAAGELVPPQRSQTSMALSKAMGLPSPGLSWRDKALPSLPEQRANDKHTLYYAPPPARSSAATSASTILAASRHAPSISEQSTTSLLLPTSRSSPRKPRQLLRLDRQSYRMSWVESAPTPHTARSVHSKVTTPSSAGFGSSDPPKKFPYSTPRATVTNFIPCPDVDDEVMSAQLWLMQNLLAALTATEYGMLTERLRIPTELFFMNDVKILAMEDKIDACEMLLAELLTFEGDLTLRALTRLESAMDYLEARLRPYTSAATPVTKSDATFGGLSPLLSLTTTITKMSSESERAPPPQSPPDMIPFSAQSRKQSRASLFTSFSGTIADTHAEGPPLVLGDVGGGFASIAEANQSPSSSSGSSSAERKHSGSSMGLNWRRLKSKTVSSFSSKKAAPPPAASSTANGSSSSRHSIISTSPILQQHPYSPDDHRRYSARPLSQATTLAPVSTTTTTTTTMQQQQQSIVPSGYKPDAVVAEALAIAMSAAREKIRDDVLDGPFEKYVQVLVALLEHALKLGTFTFTLFSPPPAPS